MYGYEILNNEHIVLYKEVGINHYVWANILEYNDDVVMETCRELVNFVDLDEVINYLDKETKTVELEPKETKGVTWIDTEKQFKKTIENEIDALFY